MTVCNLIEALLGKVKQFDKTDKHLALEAIDLFNSFTDFKSVEYETESGYHFVTGNLGGNNGIS